MMIGRRAQGHTVSAKGLQALIWDVDGVLVDTELLHFSAWNKILAEFGESMKLTEYHQFIGGAGLANMRAICAQKNIPGEPEALDERRRAHYHELRRQGIRVMVQNIDLLRQFAAIAPTLKQAVASSASERDVYENLEAAGLADFFSIVVSYDSKPRLRRKPSPDLYKLAAKQLQVPPEACLAFEDSSNGMAAAIAAGMHCIVMPNELTVGQDFSAATRIIFPHEKRNAALILKEFKFS